MSLLIACGCASHERYEPLELDPPSSEASFGARTLSDPALLAYIRDHEAGDPSEEHAWDLTRLTLAAFFWRLDLAAARAHVATARAGVGTAGQRPNPTLDLRTQFNADSSSGQSPWLLGFGFRFPIETADKRERRLALARTIVKAAELDGLQALWRARSEVRTACVELAFAGRSLALLENRRGASSSVIQALERRLELGETGKLELDVARAELAEIEVEMEAARTAQIRARASLAASLALPLAALGGVEFRLGELATAPPPDLLDRAAVQSAGLSNRLDVRRRLAEVMIADAVLRQEIAGQYPNVSLGPDYEWDQEQNKFGVAASVELPIFHHHQAQVEEARARRNEVAARFLATQADAISRIEGARVGFEGALAELGTASSVTAARKTAQASVERSVDAGELDRLDALRARSATYEAEDRELRAMQRAQEALGALEDAVQRPLGPDANLFVPFFDGVSAPEAPR